MKVKLNNIIGSVEIIRKLTQQSLPVKLAFRFLALTKQLDEQLKTFEEARISLIKKYGEELEDGGFSVKPENVQEFSVEMNELLNEEISIEFTRINVESFPDTLELSASDLGKVEWILES